MNRQISVNKTTLAGTTSGLVLAIMTAMFALEAGYVDHPNDPGGETNHGITAAVARKHGYVGPMQMLPKEFAEEIYLKDYVERPGFLALIAREPAVAHKVIDAGVNVGPGRVSRWFQMSLNELNRGGKDYPTVTVDGLLGKSSMAAYDSLVRVRGKIRACQLMLKLLDAKQTTHYTKLSHLNAFTVGWVDHRIGNVPLTYCTSYEHFANQTP